MGDNQNREAREGEYNIIIRSLLSSDVFMYININCHIGIRIDSD